MEHKRDDIIKIMDSMQEGIDIINRQYDIEYLNPALKKEFGPVGGKKCYVYFLDRKNVCPNCELQEVCDGKKYCHERHSFKHNKTYETIGMPLKNPNGSASMLEMHYDITWRNQMEKALKESESKLREKKLTLKHKDIALSEVMAQIELEKRKIKDEI